MQAKQLPLLVKMMVQAHLLSSRQEPPPKPPSQAAARCVRHLDQTEGPAKPI